MVNETIDLFVANPDSYLNENNNDNLGRIGTNIITRVSNQDLFKFKLNADVSYDPNDYKYTKNLERLDIRVHFNDLFGRNKDLRYFISIIKKYSLIELTLTTEQIGERIGVRYIELDNIPNKSVLTKLTGFNTFLDGLLREQAILYGLGYASKLSEVIAPRILQNKS